MAADIDLNYRGSEFWSAADQSVYGLDGSILSTDHRPRYCFRIYWDGTPKEELLDGGALESYTGNGNTRLYNFEGVVKNGTKGYPVLSADLFGDWREEVLFCQSSDSCTLRIYTTPNETKLSVPTLMSDHLYRMSVAWQNVAYNQPPHLGYYLPDSVACKFVPVSGSKYQKVELGNDMQTVTCKLKNCNSASVYQVWLNGERIKSYSVPTGFTFTKDNTNKTFTLSGRPSETGTYQFLIKSSGSYDNINITDTLTVEVSEPAALMGDVNGDQKVDVEDVVGIVNYILGTPAAGFIEACADVNGDGKIDVDDVVWTVNIILDANT